MGTKIGQTVSAPFPVRGRALERLLNQIECMWPEAVCEHDEISEGGLEQPFFKLRCRDALPNTEFSELFIYQNEEAYQRWERNAANDSTLIQFLFYECHTVAILSADANWVSLVKQILSECRGVENA